MRMTLVFILLFFFYLLFVGMLIVGWNKSSTRQVLDKHITNLSSPSLFLFEMKKPASAIYWKRSEVSPIKILKSLLSTTILSTRRRTIFYVFESQDPRFRLIQITRRRKENCSDDGIKVSRGQIIVTTDGDCRGKPDWLKIIAQHFQGHKEQKWFLAALRSKDQLSFPPSGP